MKWPRLILLVIIVAWLLCGCVTPGRATVDLPGGGRVTVDQPKHADESATIAVTVTTPPEAAAEPTVFQVGVSTGSTKPPTPAMIAAGKASIGWFIGAAFCFIGVASGVLRRWVPWIPTSGCTTFIAIGAGFVVFAVMGPSVDKWIWNVAMLAAVGVAAWIIVPGILANRRDKKRLAAADP